MLLNHYLALVVLAVERTICTLNKIQWLVIVFTMNMLGVLGNPTQEGLDSDVLHQDLSSKASLSQVEKVYSDFHKEMKAVEAAVRPMPMKVREQDNFFSWRGGGSKFEKMHLYQEKISKKFGKSTKKKFLEGEFVEKPTNVHHFLDDSKP